MQAAAAGLGTPAGYSGYGAEQGQAPLREAICRRLYDSVGRNPSEIFVSDGSKCDIGRLQVMFGADVSVALQDPAYPVYVDSSVIMGMTGSHDGTEFSGIQYMPCQPENGFFPDLAKAKRTDIIFFCSPNNPTGAAATRKQLEELVAFARANGSIIVYDAAYALYISNPDCPKSIYEIPGENRKRKEEKGVWVGPVED
jgi:LL-diaminopimelate aminotransferase